MPVARLGYQVREGVQRNELPGSEEVAEGGEAVLYDVRAAGPMVDANFGFPLRQRIPGDRFVLRSRREIHPATITFGDDSHQSHTDSPRSAFPTDRIVSDGHTRHQASERLPLTGAGTGFGVRCFRRRARLNGEVVVASVDRRLDVGFLPLLGR